MKKYSALALALLFYASILPFSRAEYNSYKVKNVTGDNTGRVQNITIGASGRTDNADINIARVNTFIGDNLAVKSPWVDVGYYDNNLTGTAIQSAIDNATTGSEVKLSTTTYSITTPIYITKRIFLNFNGATLRATASIDSIIQVGNGAAFTGPVRIGNGLIDGNGYATDGIKITTSYNLGMENLRIIKCTHGINFYGAANLSMTSISGKDITTNQNLYGLYFDMAGNSASYAQFSFFNYDGGDNTACIYALNSSARITIVGGDSQPQNGGDGIVLDNATITLIEHYVEPFSGYKSVDLTNGAVAVAFGGSIYGHTEDSTSKVVASGYSHHNAGGYTSTPAVMGYLSDIISADTYKWGQLFWPAKGRSGAVIQKGFTFTDDYGVVWTATTGGASASVARFSALDGRIVIPVSYDTYSNGATIWFPEEDFVVTNVSFVVTTTWEGGTDIGIKRIPLYPTDNTIVNSYIDNAQGGVASLVAGTVLTSGQNTYADNVLLNGKELFLTGVQIANSATAGASAVRWRTTGTWTAGVGYIVIRGYYLKYN